MEPFIDYYKVLGVEPDADIEQIKKAFRQLAKEHHPDISKSLEASPRFIEITNAYAILNDPARRHSFDQEHARHYTTFVDRDVVPLAREHDIPTIVRPMDDEPDHDWLGPEMAAQMETVQEMLEEFRGARSWQGTAQLQGWRVPAYRGIQIAALLILILALPLGLFRLYLTIVHPLPAFGNVQLTAPGVSISFVAYPYGQSGYFRARFYDNGELLDIQASEVHTFLPFDAPIVRITSDAYLPYMLGTAGTIKLYWCPDYDCNKELFLQTLSFVVRVMPPPPQALRFTHPLTDGCDLIYRLRCETLLQQKTS